MKTGLKSKVRIPILLLFLIVSTVIPAFSIYPLVHPQRVEVASFRLVNNVGENVTVTVTNTTTTTETETVTTTTSTTTVTPTTTTTGTTTTDVRRKSSGGTASTNLVGSVVAFVQSVAASIKGFIQSIIDAITKAYRR